MNDTSWGRRESLITPPRAPIYTYAAIALSVLVTLMSAYLWTVVMWPRLERFYLPVYIETGVLGVVQKTHSYKLPTVTDAQHRTRPALPDDVEPGQTPQPDGRPLPIQLTAWTLVYFDLRVRAEGFDLALQALNPTGDADRDLASLPPALPAREPWLTIDDVVKFVVITLVIGGLSALVIGVAAFIGFSFASLYGVGS